MNLPLAIVSTGILVGRPTGVAHVYTEGTLTPSGRWVPRGGRTACRAHTRRLAVLAPEVTAATPVAAPALEDTFRAGRRVCARCSAHLSSMSRRAEQHLRSRDDFLAAYGHLTVDDLLLANALTTTVEESHRVGYVAQLVHGPGNSTTTTGAEWKRLNDAINTRRRHLANQARTPEEIEAAARKREADEFNAKVLEAGRRQTARIDKLVRRANEGKYLTGKERQEIGMTG